MHDKELKLLGKPFEIGVTYEEITSLDAIPDIAHSAYQIIGATPWTKETDKDISKAAQDIRAGYIGTVIVTSAHLAHDGEISGILRKNPKSIDGIRIDLSMTLLPTGVAEIPLEASLVVGNGVRRFEVRAYDLSEQRFGVISCTALSNYLTSSQLMGGGTGESRVKAVGISRRSSAQVRRNK